MISRGVTGPTFVGYDTLRVAAAVLGLAAVCVAWLRPRGRAVRDVAFDAVSHRAEMI